MSRVDSFLHYTTISAYCQQSGDTPDAINKRLRSGHWLDGVHVRLPNGSKERWVNLKAVNDWVEGVKPPHQHGKS